MLHMDRELLGNNGSQGDVLLRGRDAADAGSRSERAFGALEAELYYLSRRTLKGKAGLGENVSISSVGFMWL